MPSHNRVTTLLALPAHNWQCETFQSLTKLPHAPWLDGPVQEAFSSSDDSDDETMSVISSARTTAQKWDPMPWTPAQRAIVRTFVDEFLSMDITTQQKQFSSSTKKLANNNARALLNAFVRQRWSNWNISAVLVNTMVESQSSPGQLAEYDKATKQFQVSCLLHHGSSSHPLQYSMNRSTMSPKMPGNEWLYANYSGTVGSTRQDRRLRRNLGNLQLD
jgi:hypothetical protein